MKKLLENLWCRIALDSIEICRFSRSNTFVLCAKEIYKIYFAVQVTGQPMDNGAYVGNVG